MWVILVSLVFVVSDLTVIVTGFSVKSTSDNQICVISPILIPLEHEMSMAAASLGFASLIILLMISFVNPFS
jgi:hypothetical protein